MTLLELLNQMNSGRVEKSEFGDASKLLQYMEKPITSRELSRVAKINYPLTCKWLSVLQKAGVVNRVPGSWPKVWVRTGKEKHNG